MKLTARKTMVALGTAAVMTLTGVTAPAMAADTTTTTTEAPKCGDNDKPAYSRIYSSVDTQYKKLSVKLAAIKKLSAERRAEVEGDSSALAKLDEANSKLDDVQFTINNVKGILATTPACGNTDDALYGTLQDADSQLRDAKTTLNQAETAVRGVKKFSCTAATVEQGDDSGSSSFLDFGSLIKSMGSTGQMAVVKDGTKKCVSRVDYYADKLKSIVSILTVVFTVITTVTKINETIQKQVMPKRP